MSLIAYAEPHLSSTGLELWNYFISMQNTENNVSPTISGEMIKLSVDEAYRFGFYTICSALQLL